MVVVAVSGLIDPFAISLLDGYFNDIPYLQHYLDVCLWQASLFSLVLTYKIYSF